MRSVKGAIDAACGACCVWRGTALSVAWRGGASFRRSRRRAGALREEHAGGVCLSRRRRTSPYHQYHCYRYIAEGGGATSIFWVKAYRWERPLLRYEEARAITPFRRVALRACRPAHHYGCLCQSAALESAPHYLRESAAPAAALPRRFALRVRGASCRGGALRRAAACCNRASRLRRAAIISACFILAKRRGACGATGRSRAIVRNRLPAPCFLLSINAVTIRCGRIRAACVLPPEKDCALGLVLRARRVSSGCHATKRAASLRCTLAAR